MNRFLRNNAWLVSFEGYDTFSLYEVCLYDSMALYGENLNIIHFTADTNQGL